MLPKGGTLAVMLGIHALKRNYDATIYTYNLDMFDPSWFRHGKAIKNLPEKLKKQAQFRRDKKLQHATDAYLQFLELGGKILWRELSPELIREFLNKKMPIIAGLSGTYLYQDPRDMDVKGENVYDDIKGKPSGHFVVLTDYTLTRRKILVADPYQHTSLAKGNYYKVHMQRLLNSILLGVVTYDANILIIVPKAKALVNETMKK